MNLQERIDEELLKRAKERESRERSGKYIASNFGKCFRAQFLNRKNVPPVNPLTIDTLHVFEAGKVVHDYVQQYFKAEACEVECKEDDFIGYADLVTEDAVLDIKSVNPNYFFHTGFGEKRKTFTVAEIDQIILKKKRMNILQVAYYADKLNKENIGLVFFSRDLSYGIRVHQWMGKTEDYISELRDEKSILLNFWIKDEMPPLAPRLYDGKECSYCGFYNKKAGKCQVEVSNA
jgi:hypothetical protein